MSKFKAAIVVVAVAAFFGLCIWLSPNLFGNRIRAELTKDSILKYDAGAKVYIASKDDNSKVYFGQSGKYRFYGTGALTMMESPNSTYSNFRSGFNLLVEGGSLELKTGQADILTGSVSPNGQFLALLKIDGKLSIYDISTGKTTYESKDNFETENPLKASLVAYPFFFWSDQGLVVQKSNSISNKNNRTIKLFPWQKESSIVWGKESNPLKTLTEKDINTEIVSIDPSTGNINQIPSRYAGMFLLNIIGPVDQNKVICSVADETNQILAIIFTFDLQTSSFTPVQGSSILDIIGMINNEIFYIKDNVLVYSKVALKGLETPIAINLPKLDGEQLNPQNIENLRVTSKGYLYFRHIKTAKTYLLEPVSGVYVEIPKERYPY